MAALFRGLLPRGFSSSPAEELGELVDEVRALVITETHPFHDESNELVEAPFDPPFLLSENRLVLVELLHLL